MGRFDVLTKLDETPEQQSSAPAAPVSKPSQKKPPVLANQQTSKTGTSPQSEAATAPGVRASRPTSSPTQGLEKAPDTSFLTTKEKTKYGTYLTEESIEKISIRAIQLKRDAHQIVQEAVNQYFEKIEK
jgi:hypothetical protein